MTDFLNWCTFSYAAVKVNSWYKFSLEHSRMISTFSEWTMSGVGDSAAQYVQERDDTFCLK